MVNAGMRVDLGIRESFVSAYAWASSSEVMSNKGSASFLADNLQSTIANLQSLRRAVDGSLWMSVMDRMFVSPSGKATSKSSDNSELERASVDLGKFLSFPSLDASRNKERSKPTNVDNRNGSFGNKRTRYGSKSQHWVAHEKGKNVMDGSNHPNGGVANANGVIPSVNGSNNPRGATKSGRCFSLVLSNFPDLGSLPEPMTEGGLTRVEDRLDQGTEQVAFPGNGVAHVDFSGSAIEIQTGMGLEWASIVSSSSGRIEFVFDDVSAIVENIPKEGGEFVQVDKQMSGQVTGKGKKHGEKPSTFAIRLSRLETV
ncbi:hypothetical protein NE237_003796 [Protea cynaroides]|uniref:Uncharacterized protein n=1 Tax=Protea cynaroides TaxID=273540 RepID=A0A9Q0KHP1_9MAGN|nr:hypothetical protein NE237_003796 [Protea cynaroides]